MLTERQAAILRHLCEGKGNKEIARDLGVSYETVRSSMKSILRKLGVENRTQAAIKFAESR